jgi:tetratricopeptide (TPR) repeat protein
VVRSFLIIFYCLIVLSLHSQSTEEISEQVVLLYQKGAQQEALQFLHREIDQHSRYDLWVLKSQLEYDQGLVEEAILSLSEALNISRLQHDLFFRRGMMKFEKGWYRQAIDDFTYFIDNQDGNTTAIFYKIDPNQSEQLQVKTSNMLLSEAYLHRGLCHEKLYVLSDAASDISKAVQLDSTAPNYLNYGLIRLRLGDSLNAINFIQQSVNIDPTYSLGWYNLLLLDPSVQVPETIVSEAAFLPMVQYRAVEALQNNDLMLAGHLLRQLISIYPNRYEIHELYGRLYYLRGDLDLAIEHFQQVLTLSEEYPNIHHLLGNSYFQKHSFEAAVSHYELFLARNHLRSDIWFNAAVAYHRLGDQQNMCRCVKRAIELGFRNTQLAEMKRLCQ